MSLLPNNLFPPENTNPWYASLKAAWDAVVAAVNGKVKIDGANAASVDLDTTPVGAHDVGAYTQAEVDAMISGVSPDNAQTIFGNSLWDVGNAESVPRGPGFTNREVVSGVLGLAYITAPGTTGVLTRLGFTQRTAPAGITRAEMAIFEVASDGDLTRIGSTANFSASHNASGDKLVDLLVPVTLQKGVRYAFGLLVVGTTPGQIYGYDSPGAGQRPDPYMRIPAQAAIAASYDGTAAAPHWDLIRIWALTATG